MRVAVCDDNTTECKIISEYLKRYSEEHLLSYDVVEYSGGEQLLKDFADAPFFLAFLDIYMAGLSGVETAYRLREKNKSCAIVFTTSSPDFRAEGFEVGAVHYLMKPVSYDGICIAMERCSHLLPESERYISVITNRHTVQIRLKDIIYTEVYKNQILIHTTNGIFSVYLTLSDISAQLEDKRFLPCHRCYIVNMQYITEVLEGDFVLSNGEKIPIRKNGRQQTKEAYSDYLFRSVRDCTW